MRIWRFAAEILEFWRRVFSFRRRMERPRRWFLLNASPDIRFQIEANPELRPQSSEAAATPRYKELFLPPLTGSILGLLLLREFQPLTLYATALVRRVLETNSFFRMLDAGPINCRGSRSTRSAFSAWNERYCVYAVCHGRGIAFLRERAWFDLDLRRPVWDCFSKGMECV